MKCLETRSRDGMRWRRYRLEDGRTTTTYELPASVLRALGMKRIAEKLAKHARGEVLRARGKTIDDLLQKGWKPTAIANETGVSEVAVRQRRAKLRVPARSKSAP
jgi:DNA-binding NarL/FixJ family response regulator